jgi:hypothetical protein
LDVESRAANGKARHRSERYMSRSVGRLQCPQREAAPNDAAGQGTPPKWPES